MTATLFETTTKPSTSIIVITPDIARRWLARNYSNRPVDRVIVARYREDMEAGRWAFTGQGIALDSNGDLIDGQHRLAAIAALDEGFGVPMNVTRGLPTEARFFIDQGLKRTPGSQLHMANIKNSHHNAAGARIYLLWETGLIFQDSKKYKMVSAPRIQEFVTQNPGLIDLANLSHRDVIRNGASNSVALGAFLALAQIDHIDAVTFFSRLSSGVGLDATSPILALKNRLDIDQRTKKARSSRDQLGLFFSAWNAYRKNKPVKVLTVKAWTASNFPTPA